MSALFSVKWCIGTEFWRCGLQFPFWCAVSPSAKSVCVIAMRDCQQSGRSTTAEPHPTPQTGAFFTFSGGQLVRLAGVDLCVGYPTVHRALRQTHVATDLSDWLA